MEKNSNVLASGPRGRGPESFAIHEDPQPADQANDASSSVTKGDLSGSAAPPLLERSAPLLSSKLANKIPASGGMTASSAKKQKLEHVAGNENATVAGLEPMDQLLAKLTQHQDLIQKQRRALASGDEPDSSSDGSAAFTPVTESFHSTPPKQDAQQVAKDNDEMARLKQQLYAAQNKIAKMDQELCQTRITKHTLDQVLGSPSEAEFPLRREVSSQSAGQDPAKYGAYAPASAMSSEPWAQVDDIRSEKSDTMSVGTYNSRQGHWGVPGDATYREARRSWEEEPAGPWSSQPAVLGPQPQQMPPRALPAPQPQSSATDSLPMNGYGPFQVNQPAHRSTFAAPRSGISPFAQRGAWPSYPPSNSSPEGMGPGPFHTGGPFSGPMGYQPRPIGTPLSPMATEFDGNQASIQPWSEPTYVSPIEPLNYRRMLDRTVTCNWKYIVDKIVCSNDQQASIFLQQKLKLGTTEQKHEIVDAIVAQAYPLMVNRFGNFLVQRCFEHGTSEQVVAIAHAIRGNTLNLSMDAFGCHVIQKAFDCVPENFKAIMVHELLRRIPETVIHRYACHVWQKLFELRWNDSPPQIMQYVNDALRGMWHEVALGETGSLVVQNIFENCLEEDKRPCINEVLNSIDLISRGQFGNWCIQHICEHGLPADRGHAIDHVIRNAVEYSMDQFASKVVEKCLKIGGSEFLDRYLDRVCEGRVDRPRIPLIDIASDQFGNYLIQYVLTNSSPQHREMVASHVRKHMVSLRGSKFGSRVGMLCCNPASATRPGPGVGPSMSRFMSSGINGGRLGGAYR